MMSKVARFASVLGVVALLAVGCGDDAPGGGNNNVNTNDNNNYNTSCPPTLTVQGPTAVTVMAGANVDLTQLVADCNAAPVAGAVVSYTISGSAGGSNFSVMSAVSGSDGLATTTLNAGSTAATFQVVASTPGASDVTYNVTITTDSVGLITVNMTYGGTKVFDTYQAYLFQGTACEGLDPYNISGAVMGAAPVNVISAHPQFLGIPPATNYAVAVVATFNGETLAYGCVNNIAVTAGQVTTAEVLIDDLPVVFNGLYYLDNHFDLTNALPPSVATVIHIFDEMTDDHSIDGDAATNQYGLDPAAFLLDFIFRQLCCWTATGTNPTYATCTAQTTTHPYGDLQELYHQDFQSWNGAQPRMTGACGALDQSISGKEAHKHAQEYVQGFVDDYAPDFVMNILQIIGDLSRIFTQMHIQSELTVADISISKQGNFTHELKSLEVLIHDLNGTAHTYQVDLQAAGMTTTSYSGSTTASDIELNIPPHTFVLEFGKLVQFVYLNYMLPLFNVSSSGELLALWIDCDIVGAWLYSNVVEPVVGGLITEAAVIGYCTTGLQAAGDYIDNNIDNWIDVSADFNLEGTCEAGDLDDQRVALTLVNGQWDGTLEEGTWNAPFTGTFTGTKTAP